MWKMCITRIAAVKYAYTESTAIIDGHPITINIDVRKSARQKYFLGT